MSFILKTAIHCLTQCQLGHTTRQDMPDGHAGHGVTALRGTPAPCEFPVAVVVVCFFFFPLQTARATYNGDNNHPLPGAVEGWTAAISFKIAAGLWRSRLFYQVRIVATLSKFTVRFGCEKQH